jgi:hypothetical protein
MGTKFGKRKGCNYQNEIAKAIREMWPSATNTGVDQRISIGRCDVEGTDCWIECKTGKKPSIIGAWKQSERDKERHSDDRPILVFTHFDQEKPGSGSRDLVTMSLESFMKLIGEIMDWPK